MKHLLDSRQISNLQFEMFNLQSSQNREVEP